MSEKHDAAKQLLQAAEQMRDLLTPETDGTHIWQMMRTVVSNAQAIESSVAMGVPDDPPDEDQMDEDMFGLEDDTTDWQMRRIESTSENPCCALIREQGPYRATVYYMSETQTWSFDVVQGDRLVYRDNGRTLTIALNLADYFLDSPA